MQDNKRFHLCDPYQIENHLSNSAERYTCASTHVKGRLEIMHWHVVKMAKFFLITACKGYMSNMSIVTSFFHILADKPFYKMHIPGLKYYRCIFSPTEINAGHTDGSIYVVDIKLRIILSSSTERHTCTHAHYF